MQVVLVPFCSLLDDLRVLDFSNGSTPSHLDSSLGSTREDGTREGVVDLRSMLSFSWRCAEVPDPLRQPDGGGDDAEASDQEIQSLPLTRYVYREVETTISHDD